MERSAHPMNAEEHAADIQWEKDAEANWNPADIYNDGDDLSHENGCPPNGNCECVVKQDADGTVLVMGKHGYLVAKEQDNG